MFRIFFIFMSLLLFTNILFSYDRWTDETAYTLKKNKLELGIFSPLRYGIKKDIEIETNPLLNIIMPNVSLKKNWINFNNWSLSSKHYFSYPTLFLKTISRKGIAGFLPKESRDDIAQQIYTDHSLLFTYSLSKYFEITPEVTLSLPILFNSSNNKFPTIDTFIFYNRTAAFHGDFLYKLSINITGLMFYKLYYFIDFDYYNNLGVNPYSSEGIDSVYEHKLMLIWKNSTTFSFYIGYKFILANFPYGTRAMILPIFDCIWGF